MGMLHTFICSFLDERGMTYGEAELGADTSSDADSDYMALFMPFKSKQASAICLVEVRESRRMVTFTSEYTARVPEGMRDATAEFVTRANPEVAFGHFLLDYDDGTLSFRTCLVMGDSPDESMASALVELNLMTVNLFAPAISELEAGRAGPQEALASVVAGRC